MEGAWRLKSPTDVQAVQGHRVELGETEKQFTEHPCNLVSFSGTIFSPDRFVHTLSLVGQVMSETGGQCSTCPLQEQ